MNTLGKIIFSLGAAISSLFGYHQPQQQSFIAGSAFTPVQASQFTLAGAGITNSQTTITLTSFKLPDPNKTPITMSMFGQIGYGVLEPQTSKIENITFTGITQNSNGSATLTGVSRGLSFYTPFAASSTLSLSHSGGAYFILSNSAAFYGQQFLFANNIGTSTAILTFSSTTPPRYDSVAAQAAGTYIATTSEFASIAYVNRIAITGSPVATESLNGISTLSTQLQMASSTFSALTPTVLYSKYATSSPYGPGLWIPVTQNNGTLNPNFISTSSTYVWSGNNTYSGTSLFSGAPTFNAASTFNVAPTFGTFSATSSLVTSTSTIAGNLTVALNASTTNLTVSNACNGCGMAYTASSTAYSVSSGATTYASNIPLSANNAVGTFNVTINGSVTQGTVFFSRTGLTTATLAYFVAGTANVSSYTLAWSGTSLIVTEVSDAGSNSSITGTVYWYK